jgi:hypothetical protein
MYYVKYDGPCGQSGFKNVAGRGNLRYMVGPVPANEQIVIQKEKITGSQEQPAAKATIILELYDMQGNLRRRTTASAGAQKALMNTHDLPTGNYLLRIREGEQVNTRQIRIEH